MLLNNKILLISSSGGHLLQLLTLSKALREYNLTLITEKNTSTSSKSFEGFESVYLLPHGGREKLLVYPFKFLVNILISAFRVLTIRPKVIITTGAHTAVPTCYLGKLIGSRVIYIETFAKINTPTITGRIIHPIADSFYVQWESMLKFYKKAKFVGSIY
jgi:UDP-N-acetylglucosamine:LPS N-acetylglucosamine transferase